MPDGPSTPCNPPETGDKEFLRQPPKNIFFLHILYFYILGGMLRKVCSHLANPGIMFDQRTATAVIALLMH